MNILSFIGTIPITNISISYCWSSSELSDNNALNQNLGYWYNTLNQNLSYWYCINKTQIFLRASFIMLHTDLLQLVNNLYIDFRWNVPLVRCLNSMEEDIMQMLSHLYRSLCDVTACTELLLANELSQAFVVMSNTGSYSKQTVMLALTALRQYLSNSSRSLQHCQACLQESIFQKLVSLFCHC